MENTENSNIHANQIYPLVKGMKVLFISPLFIVSRSKIGLNHNRFQCSNFSECKIPLLSYNFLMSPWLFLLFLILSLPILIIYIKRNEIRTIHCRNLLSASLALLTKRIMHRNINIISDFRGHYPEEGVILRRWRYNSLTFKFWKWIEKRVLVSSSSCTFISESMKSSYEEILPRSGMYFAPAIVDTNRFYFSSKERSEVRVEYQISDDEVVYIYTGSYGQWHDLELFYSMIDMHIQEHSINKYRAIILTGQKTCEFLEEELRYRTLTLKVSPNEVNKFLCDADVGVLPGSNKTSPSYDLLYKTMISSKAEEYFCTGLTVIASKRITEVGLLSELTNVSGKALSRVEVAKFYSSIFSLKTIKKVYEELYKID